MVGRGDWGVPSQTLTVPPFAGPGDPAIVIGPDMPFCMTSRYDALIVWRPATPIGLQYQRYMGICKAVADFSSVKVESGWFFVNLANGNCAYLVDARYEIFNDFFSHFEVRETHGLLLTAGTPGLFAGFVANMMLASGQFLCSSTGQIIIQSGAVLEIQSGGTMKVDLGAGWTIDGVSAPRGVTYFASLGINISVNTAYNNIMSGTNIFRAGRASRITWAGICTVSASTNVMGFDPLIGSTHIFSGAFGPSGSAFGIAAHGQRVVANTGGSDLSRTVALGVLTDTGTGTLFATDSTHETFLMIEDVGASLNFPSAFVVT